MGPSVFADQPQPQGCVNRRMLVTNEMIERARILISDEKLRSGLLRKKIDQQQYDVEVYDFSQLQSLDDCDYVIPITLPDILLLNRLFPDLRGIKYFAPTNEVMFRAHDKIVFNQFLCDRGFESLVPQLDSQDYPFVIKNHKDAGGANSFLIESDSDRARYQHLLKSPEFFCQAYIDGQTEYTCHVFINKNAYHSMTVRFRMNQDRYIRGIRMQPFKNVDIDLVKGQFDEIFVEILCKLGFQGFGCFNYKIVDNQPQIFELNPRIGGSAHWGINEIMGEFQCPSNVMTASGTR